MSAPLRYMLEVALLVVATIATALLCGAFPAYRGAFSLMFAVLLGWRVSAGYQARLVRKFQHQDRFEAYIETNLFSESAVFQRMAVVVLSRLLGARFGPPLFGRRFRSVVLLWRRWWEDHHESLVWCPQLRMYLDVSRHDIESMPQRDEMKA